MQASTITMPLKWKIYRIINCLLFLGQLVLLFWLVNDHFRAEFLNLLMGLLFCILAVNCIFNLLWTEKYYPDNFPSHAFDTASTVIYAFAVLGYMFILAVILFITFTMYSEGRSLTYNLDTMIRISIISCYAIAGVYTLIAQPSLRKTIRKNSQKRYAGFLDN